MFGSWLRGPVLFVVGAASACSTGTSASSAVLKDASVGGSAGLLSNASGSGGPTLTNGGASGSAHGGASGSSGRGGSTTSIGAGDSTSASGARSSAGGGTTGTSNSGGSTGTPPPPAVFPLVPSSDGRYVQDQNGTPFQIRGDAGWEAPFNLNAADQATYLNDRVSRGFNATLFSMIEHFSTMNKPPQDFARDLPFTKRLDGNPYTGSPNGTTTTNGNTLQYAPDPYTDVNSQSPDFTTPNEAYWKAVDAYVALCAQKGVLVAVWPSYLGYGGADEGWMGEMVANDAVMGAGSLAGQSFADPTKSTLWNYGAWIANRYKNATNLLWVYGGDYGSNPNRGGPLTTTQQNAEASLVAGTLSISGQKSAMRTAHWARPSVSTDVSLPSGAVNVEGAYCDQAAAQYARNAYAHTPTLPSFEIEDYYEGDPNGGQGPDRRYQWWSVLSSIGGYYFGSVNLWPFATGWQSVMNSQTSQDMARLNTFMAGIPWYTLVPSGLNGAKVLVTAGGGAENPQSDDYVAAAVTSNGTLLLAYVPPAHSGSITVDLSAMSGSSHARWFNPATGAYTDAQSGLPNAGTQVFTPPTNNADFLLVVSAP